jgi:glyoxylase-like metal-dependent hydrolase (beta-lactamase superfamily II)
MKKILTLLLVVFIHFSGHSQDNLIRISDDIELIKISANAYVHVSYTYLPSYGRVASNGLIFVNGKEAFLFDTPMTDSLTMELVSFIRNSMKLKITGFVPNHWHADCIGGLAYLKDQKIESYANQMTINIAMSKKLPVPDHGFKDSIELRLGNRPIKCYYLGAAHSLDNIVVWIPSEKILFPGCMVKGLSSENLGNTADGDLIAYPKTIEAVIRKFPAAKIVVPGHGDFGGLELLTHTMELAAAKSQVNRNTREIWLDYMDTIARPVISNLASDGLKNKMTITLSNTSDNPEQRKKVAYLEAFARTLCGISPWLNIEGGSAKEIALRNQYRRWVLDGIANAVDSTKKDYMLWTGSQPLVDASFFALALVRCPWIWDHSDIRVQERIVAVLQSTRKTIPAYSNWILFPAMIEAFFCKYGQSYDPVRIEYGIREFSQQWYVGDGMFSDGMHFVLDYYNSYVIQPYLLNILDAVNTKNESFNWFSPKLEKITTRYAQVQERSINSDGSFPVFGRSIVYRGGAFHLLSDMALRHKLPASVTPAQVRCALTEVIVKTIDCPGTFTPDGWLNIGLHGNQPDLADVYINTGSLYLCTTIFLPLGLPSTDPFWADADAPWTSKKIWNGIDVEADHSMRE